MNFRSASPLSFLLLFFLLSTLLQGQSEEDQITAALDGYITGTAYNYPEQVKSSFMPGANMFLDHKDQPLFIMKIEEYAERLGGREAGEFNGRVTNILSIDRYANIASVKLEVLLPGLNRRFIDFLLLRKLPEGWKIISKTAGSAPTDRTTDKVLMVLSSAYHHGSSDIPAGNSFSEVAIAYDAYVQAGYHVDFISPKGGAVPLAYINPGDSLQLHYLYDADFMYALQNTAKPADIDPNDYRIIQFPGGSAPVYDIPQHERIQEIAMHIYEKNEGVIAAVCHGTAALVNLKTSAGKYLVAGKVVNGVPEAHENKEIPQYQHYPFLIEPLLRARGGKFKHSGPRSSHMEVDGRLVTGQNVLSSAMVSRKSVELVRVRDKE